MSEEVVPRPFRLMALVLIATVVGMAYSTSGRMGIGELGLLLFIAALAWLSENFAPVLGGYSASLALPLTMAALLLYGPLGAALVAAVSALKTEAVRHSRAFWTSCYNLGQLVLAALVSGWLYSVLGGRFLSAGGMGAVPLGGHDFPRVLLPLMVAAVACAGLNVVMTALGVSVLNSAAFVDVIRSASTYLPSLLALAAVGYLVAQVMAIEALGLVLFVFPLFVAGQLYQRFVALRDAYTNTIRTFVHALEAKDGYTSGHSERVSRYAVMIARSREMDAKTIELVEHAALLHDLGKLGLPISVLVKQGTLTSEEWALVREHPVNGARMVGRIPPLAGLAEAVAQHHERLDGTGYPSGLRGDTINVVARILAVADAYDAMTSSRPYRSALTPSEAREELRKCSLTQFDSTIVGSLEQALFEDDLSMSLELSASKSVARSGSTAEAGGQ